MGLTADDQLAIRQLVARYSHAMDSGDGAALAGTFVDDGVFDAGGLVLEARNALEEFARGFPDSVRAPRHVVSNLVIEGDGDRATGQAYVQLYALVGDPPRQEVTHSGKYADTLVKVDGIWRFVTRTFTKDG